MRATDTTGTPVPMTHAELFTSDLCRIYEGPHQAKRMAGGLNWALETCRSYIRQRRAVSLDAAISLAAANAHVEAALLARIREARQRNEEAQQINVAARRGGVAVGCSGVHGSSRLVRPQGAAGQGQGAGAAAVDGSRAARAGRVAAVGRVGRGRV